MRRKPPHTEILLNSMGDMRGRCINRFISQAPIYDADERRQTLTVAGQAVVHYTLDPDSRLTQITQNGAIVAFNYDSASRRTSLT
jgi:YD repeat-containing protein